MNESYKVSVITATYRRESELKRSLQSLARQTFKAFEIILVDDNALPEWNDRVTAIVKEFKEQFPEVQLNYIQNYPSKGSANARNVGIYASKGDYVTFLDDDDLYAPEKIEKQYEYMTAQGLDYSVTDLDLYYDDETLSEHRTRYYIKKTDQNSLITYHVMHHMACPDTMMFKKEYLWKIGAFPPIDMGDDFYLMERAILNGGKFGYLNRCDVKAYVHYGEVGLSGGQKNIDYQKSLLKYKKKYYHLLDRKSIRFTKMRHHAVLAFTYLRMHQKGGFVRESMASFFTDPVACTKLFAKRRKKNRGK